MNRYIKHIAAYVLAISVGIGAASCLGDDDVEISAKCFIDSFSVGDITTAFHTTTAQGIDSIYKRTIDGKNVRFNIDQIEGHIYSVDSLPAWVDLSRVVPSISYNGTLYVNIDSVYYPITGSGDSINFEKPVEFMVVATDGVSYKHYTVDISHVAIAPDSLLWTTIADHNLADISDRWLGTFGGRLTVIGTIDGNTVYTTSPDAMTWSTPQTIVTPSDEQIVTSTIVTFQGKLYANDTDGNIFTTTDVAHWDKVGQHTVSRLLTADPYYLYAIDAADGNIIATSDLSSWQVVGHRNLDRLPLTDVTTFAYPARTNPNIYVNVMLGINPQVENAVAWYKIATGDESHQTWDYINITSENAYPMPGVAPLSAFRLDDALFAMPGTNSQFYRSDDNGITWHPVTRYQFPPTGLKAYKAVSITAIDNTVWMMQSTDNHRINIWKGRLNR